MTIPTPPKNLPRFLPTLTEVVQLPVVAAPAPQPIPPPTPVPKEPPAVDQEALVERIMVRLEGPLQATLQAAIAALLVDKLRELEPRVRDEVDRAVRLSVQEALLGEIAARNA
jgi:hypothetical protein